MKVDKIQAIVRFVVRDALDMTLFEMRSEERARAHAKTAVTEIRPLRVVRVEQIGNLTRERHVASY